MNVHSCRLITVISSCSSVDEMNRFWHDLYRSRPPSSAEKVAAVKHWRKVTMTDSPRSMAASRATLKEASDKEYDKPWVFSYNVLPERYWRIVFLIIQSAHCDTKVEGYCIYLPWWERLPTVDATEWPKHSQAKCQYSVKRMIDSLSLVSPWFQRIREKQEPAEAASATSKGIRGDKGRGGGDAQIKVASLNRWREIEWDLKGWISYLSWCPLFLLPCSWHNHISRCQTKVCVRVYVCVWGGGLYEWDICHLSPPPKWPPPF